MMSFFWISYQIGTITLQDVNDHNFVFAIKGHQKVPDLGHSLLIATLLLPAGQKTKNWVVVFTSDEHFKDSDSTSQEQYSLSYDARWAKIFLNWQGHSLV